MSEGQTMDEMVDDPVRIERPARFESAEPRDFPCVRDFSQAASEVVCGVLAAVVSNAWVHAALGRRPAAARVCTSVWVPFWVDLELERGVNREWETRDLRRKIHDSDLRIYFALDDEPIKVGDHDVGIRLMGTAAVDFEDLKRRCRHIFCERAVEAERRRRGRVSGLLPNQ